MQERKKILASGGSAVGLSMLASFVGLCCIGPWTVALLGVSGAVSMARWQPFRPYILTLAGGILAWAFWRTYRLRRGCRAPGVGRAHGSTPDTRSNRIPPSPLKKKKKI